MSTTDSTSSTTMTPVLLTTSNWYVWKPQMELSLAHEGLWAYASGSYPRPVVDAANPSAAALKELRLWTIAEGKTRANIILACEPGLRSDLMNGPVGRFSSAEL